MARRRPALALLLAAAAAAGHEAPPTLPGSIELRGGRVVTSLDLGPAYPPDLQRLLSNGLGHVVTLYVALVPEHGGDAVALYGREVDVVYDVWEEAYRVVVKDPASPAGRRHTFTGFAALRAFLDHARDLDLGPAAELERGRWTVRTRVELDPVSAELLERTREFLAHPAGRSAAPSRSVLGAMASYLLRDADPGADMHLFSSPAFTARDLVSR